MDGGVPPGAKMPNQAMGAKSANPLSKRRKIGEERVTLSPRNRERFDPLGSQVA